MEAVERLIATSRLDGGLTLRKPATSEIEAMLAFLKNTVLAWIQYRASEVMRAELRHLSDRELRNLGIVIRFPSDRNDERHFRVRTEMID